MANPPRKGLAPPAPASRLEYDKTDWANMGWGEVGSRALQNLPSSGWRAIKGLNPAEMATGAGGLLLGILRKAHIGTGDPTRDPRYIAAQRGGNDWNRYVSTAGTQFGLPSEQYRQRVLQQGQAQLRAGAEADKMLTDMYNMYGKRYGSMAGFKEALATDPVSVAFDVNTAARLSGAGMKLGAAETAALAPRLPSALAASAKGAASAYAAGAKGAEKVAAYTDPFAPVTKVTKATANLAGKGIGLVRKIPETSIFANGKFTPAAMSALKEAFPNLTLADFNNPKLQSTIVKTMSSRGITPAAARQSLADYHGVTIPTSRLTGKAPMVAPKASDMTTATKNAQSGIAGIAERSFPHDNENIGMRLKESEQAARSNIDTKYEDARSIPGQFDPAAAQIIQDQIDASVKQAFPQYKSTNLPKSTFPQGMNVLEDFKNNFPTEVGEHGLNMGLLDDKRSGIGNRFRGMDAAIGKDRRLLSAIQDGVDNGIAQAIDDGLFQGDSNQLLKTWNDARKSNKDYYLTYNGTDRFGNPDIVSEALAHADKGNFEKAGNHLINNMFDSQTGTMLPDAPNLWAQTHAVSPELGTAVDSGVRRKVADQVATGNMSVSDANDAMSSFKTNGRAAFDPEHEATIRQVGTLKGTLDTVPDSSKVSSGNLLKRGAEAGGIGSIAGYITSGVTGIPPQYTIPALSALEAAAHTKLQNLRGPQSELSGVVPAERAPSVDMGTPLPANVRVPGAVSAQLGSAQEQQKREAEAASNVGPTTQIVAPGTATGDVEETMHNEAAPAPKPAGIDDEDLVIGKIERATGGRVAYATGGKIKKSTHEELVVRLINKAKQAKKHSDSTTKPLLNANDDAIASALAVAQKSI